MNGDPCESGFPIDIKSGDKVTMLELEVDRNIGGVEMMAADFVSELEIVMVGNERGDKFGNGGRRVVPNTKYIINVA